VLPENPSLLLRYTFPCPQGSLYPLCAFLHSRSHLQPLPVSFFLPGGNQLSISALGETQIPAQTQFLKSLVLGPVSPQTHLVFFRLSPWDAWSALSVWWLSPPFCIQRFSSWSFTP